MDCLTSRLASPPVTPLGGGHGPLRGSPCSSTSTPRSDISTISQKLDNVMTAFSEHMELLAQSKEECEDNILYSVCENLFCILS